MNRRCFIQMSYYLLVCLFLMISTASARVCFLPDSTDCGEGDVVGGGNVEIPCQHSTCPAYNSNYQECYDERTYNNGGVNLTCKQIRCKLSKSECEAQEANANNSQCCNFDSKSGCYYMGSCPTLCNRDIFDSEKDLGEDYNCTLCKDKNGTFYNCTPKDKECSDINSNYSTSCSDSQIAHKVTGIKDSNGNQCYTCESKQPDPDDDSPSCYDTVVTIECLRYTPKENGKNNDRDCSCENGECSNPHAGITFPDGTHIGSIDLNGRLGAYACKMTAKGIDALSIYRFYYQHHDPSADGSWHACEQGEVCIAYSDSDYSENIEIEYNDPYKNELKRVALNSYYNDYDFTIKLGMREDKNENELVIEYDEFTQGECFINAPEIKVCDEDKTCSDYDKTYLETSSIKDNDPEDICPYLYSSIFGYVKNLGDGYTDLKVGEYKFKFGGGDNAEFVDTSVAGCTACRWKTCEEIDSDFGNSSLDCPAGYNVTPVIADWAVGSDGRCYECVRPKTTMGIHYQRSDTTSPGCYKSPVPSKDNEIAYSNWLHSLSEWYIELYELDDDGEYWNDDEGLPFDVDIITNYTTQCRDGNHSWEVYGTTYQEKLHLPKGAKYAERYKILVDNFDKRFISNYNNKCNGSCPDIPGDASDDDKWSSGTVIFIDGVKLEKSRYRTTCNEYGCGGFKDPDPDKEITYYFVED